MKTDKQTRAALASALRVAGVETPEQLDAVLARLEGRVFAVDGRRLRVVRVGEEHGETVWQIVEVYH